MILLEDILELHSKSINDFGGSHGIRELNMLESAISRPFQTFDGNELYPTVFEKVASLGESLIKNHPFVDGNKRTGLLAMMSLLFEFGYWINIEEEKMYDFVIHIATSKISFEEIVKWLEINSTKK